MEKAIRRAKKEGKIAKTAQQTIPYEEMYPDGICRITNRLYSKSVLCDDINYAEASDDEKAVLFELYCKLVNYFGPSVGFELSVICYPADLVEYRKMLALNPQGDQFDEIRKEYSDMLVRQVSKSRYERRICLTYTIEADGIRQARSRLEQIDNDVVGHFRALTVAAHPMDGYERLTILHRCLHLEENRKFRFNWDSLKHTGLSSKDYIAPSSFFFKDGRYFRSGASFGAVSFLQIRATKLYDTLLNSILNMEGSQIVSIHAKALDQNAALKAVKRKLSDLDKAKIDEQKRAVRSGFDMDILPPDLVTFGKEAQKLLEDLQNHDEKMFMVTILVVHAASSRQKLENLIYSANGITNTQNCDLIRLDYQQEQGFVSALPIGINQVEIQRGLTTSGTAIFLPFRACEVFQPKGVYYGLNATTNRMILADRKTLKCPNGVVLGTPGSGKSFSCKREAADVYLHTTDDILFLDPENEYTSLCQQLSGQVIRLAPDSHDYINPLDVDLTTNTGENPLLMKADFIMSFCELILSAAQGGLKPIEKSVIDRCIPKIYRQLIKDPRPENMPILGDLYECLRAQQEEQAQELATALELYVFGSLNYLNHRTNVNVDNRVACYDISGLGQNLKKPGMLTVQNNIWQRTTVNRYAGKTTRIYLDEFHLLLKEPQTAAYTAEIYKRFRKWNGIPTSLTQNVKDLLESPEIENILENSDFILMLNQAASDRNILAQRLGISPQELGHITNSDAGLDHFDSWAAAFGETVTALELAPEGGGFRAKTRFAKFFNLPELMAMWKEAADIQTAEMLNLPVPASENITVVTKPSEFQKELVAELGERAEDVRNRLVEPREDNMLKITSDGRKLALDQRLAYPELPDDPESKVNACVGNVLKVWRDTEPQKGAQLVFCDLSTPHGDGSFNVYDDIKQKLMAQGVPPEQIAFIHDAKTDVQKAELFSKVRKGQVRVLLGSTSKMGAGTNVQTRLAALHHLDCPWRPADIEQREGRILRQGNQFKSVKIFKYVTEGTFDAYNWGLIENKQKFIGQLMSGKNPSRSCEDVDEAALSYAEVKALASGDPRIMEKTELDGQVTKLKLLKANHESQRYALEDNLIKFYPQAIKREQETIADLETDIRHLEAHTPPDKEHFSMTVMGTTYTEKKEAGQAIIAAFESLKDLSDKVELGEYRGFPMTLWVSDSGLSPKLQITLKHTRSHTFEPGSDPFGNITRMDNVLEGMRDNLEQHQTVLGNLLQQMEDAKVEVKRPFPQEAELAEKSERLAALNVALNIGGKDKPNSRERQKHDGKTSIKRLLRRMGVESAASAAPKKDKEMEVAI